MRAAIITITHQSSYHRKGDTSMSVISGVSLVTVSKRRYRLQDKQEKASKFSKPYNHSALFMTVFPHCAGHSMIKPGGMILAEQPLHPPVQHPFTKLHLYM